MLVKEIESFIICKQNRLLRKICISELTES